MLNLKSFGQVDQRTHLFLKQNPSISESLIEELGKSLSQVATLIEPILNAPSRCEVSSNYIQAVTTGRTTFLTTNLTNVCSTQVTEMANSWLIGRSSNCAIAILEKSISRCHAVIGHHPHEGFYMMDLGSSNGTWVNHTKLVPLQQQFLKDGDLIEFNKIRAEFFISGYTAPPPMLQETHY
ncbi:FHA domain-containing protein [Leptolyngbyaceae cyanobacterium UHCC 1019]